LPENASPNGAGGLPHADRKNKIANKPQ